jgi:hypothetical protein
MPLKSAKGSPECDVQTIVCRLVLAIFLHGSGTSESASGQMMSRLPLLPAALAWSDFKSLKLRWPEGDARTIVCSCPLAIALHVLS